MSKPTGTREPSMPDPERRKILTALVAAATISAPVAKVLLAKVPDYGDVES